MNSRNTIIGFISLFTIVAMVIIQFIYLNSYASTWDQVDFAFALERYDLLAMQPHFPGYPYFILGGSFVHLFVEDKAAALTAFNILIYLSAVFPMYQLATAQLSKSYSLLVTALVYSASYVIVVVNQPMSEGAALAALWWFIWSVHLAYRKNTLKYNLLMLFLLSIVLGIRLSYVPFATGALLLFYIQWKNKHFTFTQLLFQCVIAAVFQLVWVLGVAFTEGSLTGFIKLALAFTSGHFNDWGGTVTVSDMSIWERIATFIFQNIGWVGFTAESTFLLCFICVFIGLFFVKFRSELNNRLLQLFIILIFTYFLWALFAQNIEKARHIIPVVSLGMFVLFVFSRIKHITVVLAVSFLLIQGIHTASLLNQQGKELPATYQLASYLKEQKDSGVVYTWEETRVLDYLQVGYAHKEIKTYSKFLVDQSYYKGKKILLTDKVVQGFKLQGVNLNGKIKEIAEFSSNPLFDPVYDHIVLYEWID